MPFHLQSACHCKASSTSAEETVSDNLEDSCSIKNYAPPSLNFTFVIDFLSIRKVIIFSAIATDDRHPLRSHSIHQNAAVERHAE